MPKRIGRGGKRGSYCGRGVEGQKSRAGRKMVPPIRQFIKKYPKLRGYRFKSQKEKPAVVNITALERNFEKGEVVSPQSLFEKKLIRRMSGKMPVVKVLGMGRLTKKIDVKDCKLSETAKKKIKKAGGAIN